MSLLLLTALSAHALDCDGSDHVLPEDGATDIATSASVVVRSPFPEDARTFALRDADGAAVQVTTEARGTGEGPRFLFLDPDAPLAADATYEVTVDDGGEVSVLSTFTTDDGVDTTAPTGGEVLDAGARYVSEEDGDWGEERLIDVTLAEATDDDPVFYEVQFSEGAGFASPRTVISFDRYVGLGIGLCETTWSELPFDVPFHVRARAVDLSGNATPWSEADAPVTVRDDDGGDTGLDTGLDTGDDVIEDRGCTTAPVAPAAGLILLALAALRRRR